MSNTTKKHDSKKNSLTPEENWQSFSPYIQDTVTENPQRRIMFLIKICTGIGLTALVYSFIDMCLLDYDNAAVNAITLLVADLFIALPWVLYFELINPQRQRKSGRVPGYVFILWTLIAVVLTLASIIFVLELRISVDTIALQLWILLNVVVAVPWCLYSCDVIYSALRTQSRAVKDEQRYSTTMATVALCVSIINLGLIIIGTGN